MVNLWERFGDFLAGTPFNSLFSGILNNVNDAVIIENQEGVVVFANQKVETYLGYTPEELIGLTKGEAVKLLTRQLEAGENKKPVEEKFLKGNVTIRRKFFHKSGQAIPMEVQAHPIFDKENKLYGKLFIFKDLHEDLLITITNLVNSSLSLKEVLQNTTCAVVDHLGLASTAIFLPDEAKRELRLTSCNVFTSEEDLAKVVFKIGEGPPGQIFAQQKPVYVRNLRTESSIPESTQKFHTDKSSVGFPLVFDNEILGVIAFDADMVRDFSDKEMAVFQKIAIQVALAIYKAQVFSHLMHLSSTDGLTGLFNHRYFQGRLTEEINARKKKRSISLLMLDVDNFKHYNDTMGHQVGDNLLKELAGSIKENVRDFDIVARYGGEEFAVILVDCSKEEALQIAERIRSSVEHKEFYGGSRQPEGRITISIGVASYPEIKNRQKLLSYADKALYRAKRNGRNRVEIYTAS